MYPHIAPFNRKNNTLIIFLCESSPLIPSKRHRKSDCDASRLQAAHWRHLSPLPGHVSGRWWI